MGYKDEWKGTKKELLEVINETIDNLQVDLDIRISTTEMRKLFCEAFSRNLVQNELREMIEYIATEEGLI